MVAHPWRVLWRPYMHQAKPKLRNLDALQPANPTDPTGYPAADWHAFQPEKFVLMLLAFSLKHVAAPYHYQPD